MRTVGLVAKSCLTLMTPWTVACQAPLSVGFSRQNYWSVLPFPSPVDLPNPGIKPKSPARQADSLPTELQGKPCEDSRCILKSWRWKSKPGYVWGSCQQYPEHLHQDLGMPATETGRATLDKEHIRERLWGIAQNQKKGWRARFREDQVPGQPWRSRQQELRV